MAFLYHHDSALEHMEETAAIIQAGKGKIPQTLKDPAKCSRTRLKKLYSCYDAGRNERSEL